jgi:hypothetical protein
VDGEPSRGISNMKGCGIGFGKFLDGLLVRVSFGDCNVQGKHPTIVGNLEHVGPRRDEALNEAQGRTIPRRVGECDMNGEPPGGISDLNDRRIGVEKLPDEQLSRVFLSDCNVKWKHAALIPHFKGGRLFLN